MALRRMGSRQTKSTQDRESDKPKVKSQDEEGHLCV